jgi:hypothetical protein
MQSLIIGNGDGSSREIRSRDSRWPDGDGAPHIRRARQEYAALWPPGRHRAHSQVKAPGNILKTGGLATVSHRTTPINLASRGNGLQLSKRKAIFFRSTAANLEGSNSSADGSAPATCPDKECRQIGSRKFYKPNPVSKDHQISPSRVVASPVSFGTLLRDSQMK